MKNFLAVAVVLSGFTSIFLSGCVSSSFKANIEPNEITIGMPESDFVKEYGHLGENIYYSTTDMNSFLWILNTGSKRFNLTGNAFLGGTYSIRHHTMVVSFEDNKVSKVYDSYMDSHYKQRMEADNYKAIYWLSESLNTCKSYLSNQERGRYGHVLSEMANSWVYSEDVFNLINEYNRSHSNFISPQGENQCNDAIAYLEKASNELAQRNKQNN